MKYDQTASTTPELTGCFLPLPIQSSNRSPSTGEWQIRRPRPVNSRPQDLKRLRTECEADARATHPRRGRGSGCLLVDIRSFLGGWLACLFVCFALHCFWCVAFCLAFPAMCGGRFSNVQQWVSAGVNGIEVYLFWSTWPEKACSWTSFLMPCAIQSAAKIRQKAPAHLSN